MKTEHLTDMDIQIFSADRGLVDQNVQAHLHSCAVCQTAYENYMEIFSSIRNSSKPEFDFELSQLVITQLPVVKKTFPWTLVWITSLSVMIMGIAAIFFITPVIALLQSVSDLLIVIAVMAAVVIVIFQSFEIVRTHRKQMNKVFNH